MRMLERNEKLVYHSKRNLTEEGVEYYDVPVAFKCNPMPVSVDWTRAGKGEIQTGLLRFIISRDMLRQTVVFSPYGYEHPIDGESWYGFDEEDPYGWVEDYLTRWTNGLVVGDRMYVDTVPPTAYADYVIARGADYVVTGVENTPNYITAILKRLTI